MYFPVLLLAILIAVAGALARAGAPGSRRAALCAEPHDAVHLRDIDVVLLESSCRSVLQSTSSVVDTVSRATHRATHRATRQTPQTRQTY